MTSNDPPLCRPFAPASSLPPPSCELPCAEHQCRIYIRTKAHKDGREPQPSPNPGCVAPCPESVHAHGAGEDKKSARNRGVLRAAAIPHLLAQHLGILSSKPHLRLPE